MQQLLSLRERLLVDFQPRGRPCFGARTLGQTTVAAALLATQRPTTPGRLRHGARVAASRELLRFCKRAKRVAERHAGRRLLGGAPFIV
ncbi:hypothetical protein CYMTET_29686 [Cymbomonas tetramitiformis]|uniref:Uncharacterized protein n=1 Tax=Cymbomonas tetramitiformis TaxID=36881 RepID=A0AAE0FKJ1_9CHLO|nr:hypothetical protein CYMTET_29686 [Cymbomonas tetramitiformis]